MSLRKCNCLLNKRTVFDPTISVESIHKRTSDKERSLMWPFLWIRSVFDGKNPLFFASYIPKPLFSLKSKKCFWGMNVSENSCLSLLDVWSADNESRVSEASLAKTPGWGSSWPATLIKRVATKKKKKDRWVFLAWPRQTPGPLWWLLSLDKSFVWPSVAPVACRLVLRTAKGLLSSSERSLREENTQACPQTRSGTFKARSGPKWSHGH